MSESVHGLLFGCMCEFASAWLPGRALRGRLLQLSWWSCCYCCHPAWRIWLHRFGVGAPCGNYNILLGKKLLSGCALVPRLISVPSALGIPCHRWEPGFGGCDNCQGGSCHLPGPRHCCSLGQDSLTEEGCRSEEEHWRAERGGQGCAGCGDHGRSAAVGAGGSESLEGVA